MGSAVVVPLSVVSIRKLRRNLNALAKELKGDLGGDIERAMCRKMATKVQSNFAGMTDLDGNYLGGENPNASLKVEPALEGHELVWRGEQIAYLEFGTGATGAMGSYGGTAMAKAGYHPDPTKKSWGYEDAKLGGQISHGIPPYAPMYDASRILHSPVMKEPAIKLLNGAVNRAKRI